MPDRSRQKERKRLKRKRKQEAIRKVASLNPLRAITRLPAEVQCWTNSNWKHTRQAGILVLRQARSGRCAVANFLVDFGMLGLKDVWGRFDMTSGEFFEEVLAPFRDRFPMEQIEPAEAARLIMGGIRFAHDNGFRLPNRYERWLSLVGDFGDWRCADVSDFEMEFAGTIADLRSRLIGQPVGEFLVRKDIKLTLADEIPDLLRAEEIAHEGMGDAFKRHTAEGIREGLIARGQTPSRLLDRGLDLFTESMVQVVMDTADRVADASDRVGDASAEPESKEALMAALDDRIMLEPEEDREDLRVAALQIATMMMLSLALRADPSQVDG